MFRPDEKTSYFFKPFPVTIYIHICQVNNYLEIFKDLLNTTKKVIYMIL